MRTRIISGMLAIIMLLTFLPGMAVKASAAPSLTTSEEAVALIKAYEGFSAKAYWDNTQWSIGYGTKSTQGATITIEEAHAAMLLELQEVEKALNEFAAKYGLYLSQNQFDALASLSYNCGTKWMTTSGRLRQAVTEGKTGNDFLFAISLWANISSVPNAGLLKRRMSEASLYLTGTYDKGMPSNYAYVIFNPNGGTPGHSGEDKMQGYCTDTAVNIMVEDPTRTGYTFRGWYTAASGGEKVESLTAAVAGKTLYAQWLGRIDDALCNAALRGNKDLLGGDVRIEVMSEQACFTAALEFGVLDHADAEIRAVRAAVDQRLDAEAVEVGAALGKVFVVRLPRGDGVVAHARGG